MPGPGPLAESVSVPIEYGRLTVTQQARTVTLAIVISHFGRIPSGPMNYVRGGYKPAGGHEFGPTHIRLFLPTSQRHRPPPHNDKSRIIDYNVCPPRLFHPDEPVVVGHPPYPWRVGLAVGRLRGYGDLRPGHDLLVAQGMWRGCPLFIISLLMSLCCRDRVGNACSTSFRL